MKKRPILTIAIPTWNRAAYLRMNLRQLASQCIGAMADDIEILISDNCSDDETGQVVASFDKRDFPIRYIRNHKNIGSDCNIAQCFNEASGKYVMVLGDDDLLVDGAVEFFLRLLKEGSYGAITVRAYGYDDDFRDEYPGGRGRIRKFTDAGDFIVAAGILPILISANIICKDILPNINACEFCGSNLVQTHMIYRAALAAEKNIVVDKYLIAYKRNNTGGYVFSQVFVDRFGEILDEYQRLGLPQTAIARLERRLVVGFFPFYVFREILANVEETIEESRQRYRKRYDGYWTYYLFLAPIFYLPRHLAIGWGAIAVLVGRVLNGDLRRGIFFLWHRL
ncbi:MAG: glycosyltransferase family 2 protein, partial [Deltaproteobacteria bacterium]|nr:glycosyltransferase family 2 protein [Deltaproteobacteria bacterium]